MCIRDSGSALNNKRGSPLVRGGYGCYFADGDTRNLALPFLLPEPTNNRCELYAGYRAIEQQVIYMIHHDMIKDIKTPDDRVELRICTDSEYVMKSMTIGVPKWKKNNWKTTKGKPVKNQDLLKGFDMAREIYKKILKITFKHVKAHRKKKDVPKNDLFYYRGNFMADKFANIGSKLASKI